MDDVSVHPRMSITSISVVKLFGLFTYTLPEVGAFDEIAILYGDNGTGKTTILKLVFHLLSAEPRSGHRTVISKIPFVKFVVQLSSGVTISAERLDGPTSIPILFSAHKHGKLQAEWLWIPKADHEPQQQILFEDGALRLVSHIENDFHVFTKQIASAKGKERAKIVLSRLKKVPDYGELQFTSFLRELELAVYLISSDRRILGDDIARDDRDSSTRRVAHAMREHAAANTIEVARNEYLKAAAQSARVWISGQAVKGTNAGADTANNVYFNILKNISTATAEPSGDANSLAAAAIVASTLQALAERNQGYADLEFTSPLRIDEIRELLLGAESATAETMTRILRPYTDGIRARLDALEPLYKLTSTLLNNINEYFLVNRVSFTLTKGFSISNASGEIPLNYLSSGEQNLLLLFCRIIASGGKANLFIVDEPEISLNVKWQRRLIDSILEITPERRSTFLFATHSLELISQHQNRVARLSSEELS